MKITRMAQSTIFIENDAGTVVAIDPYHVLETDLKADLVLITHSHPDHYDPKSINEIKKDNTIIVCPASCKKIVSTWKARGVAAGDTLEMAGITIKVVPAYNKKKPFHSRGKKYVGYILSIDEKSLYHAGDTDFIEEMKDIQSPDVMFCPIGGFFTMNANDAIEAIKAIKPAIFVPIHEIKQDLSAFASKVQPEFPELKICTLHVGESMSL